MTIPKLECGALLPVYPTVGAMTVHLGTLRGPKPLGMVMDFLSGETYPDRTLTAKPP